MAVIDASSVSATKHTRKRRLLGVGLVAVFVLSTPSGTWAQVTCNNPASTLTRSNPVADNPNFCGGNIAEASACFGASGGEDKLALGLTLEGTEDVDITCTTSGDASLCIMTPDCQTILVAEGTASARLRGDVPSQELKIIVVANNDINPICFEEPKITCNGASWGQARNGGLVEFVSARVTEDEGAGTAEVRVERRGGDAGAVAVNYRTSDGTAVAGEDYQLSQGTLLWKDGEAGQKSLFIPILDDGLPEGGETVRVSLSSPAGDATGGSRNEATLLIADDDAPSDTFTDDDYPGYRFRVTISSGDDDPPRPAVVVTAGCPKETVCIAGAIPDRIEMFLRIVGPKPNGFLQTNIIRFSTSKIDAEITQIARGVTKKYSLPVAKAGGSDNLDGLVDREGFVP